MITSQEHKNIPLKKSYQKSSMIHIQSFVFISSYQVLLPHFSNTLKLEHLDTNLINQIQVNIGAGFWKSR